MFTDEIILTYFIIYFVVLMILFGVVVIQRRTIYDLSNKVAKLELEMKDKKNHDQTYIL